MKKVMRYGVLGWLAVAGGASAMLAQLKSSPPPDAFGEPDLTKWKERSFVGNTDYTVVDDMGIAVLRGHTQGQASILIRETSVDVSETPWLEWSWKISNTYGEIDETMRTGDDYPARLYVVVKTGFLPFETLALNYVWASDMPPGSFWPNAFTDKAMMIAVDSGNEHVGAWRHQRRNVVDDFKQAFGEHIDMLDGYAVMVDGDNGQREATAWFGRIAFQPD